MRIYVTGAHGFVGRWLTPELIAAGHEVIPSPPAAELSLTDTRAFEDHLRSAEPDAVVHLAAVSFAADAAADPVVAMQVNVAGTSAVLHATSAFDSPPPTLIVSSSEVYGNPDPESLPISEAAALRPRTIYGLTKVAQEAAAVWGALRSPRPLVVARPFNHTGPGQRSVFAVPSFVERVLRARDGRAATIPAGNVEVRRDFGDVRDVVRAYRLILEWMLTDPPTMPTAFNIATGRATTIREIIETLCRLAHTEPILAVDERLVRAGEAPEIVGDASALRAAVGWSPEIELSTTLADMLETASSGAAHSNKMS